MNTMLLITFSLVLLINCAKTKEVNVLFVVIDDLKPNLGAYGYKNAVTPNFDALANRSFVFTNAFAQVFHLN